MRHSLLAEGHIQQPKRKVIMAFGQTRVAASILAAASYGERKAFGQNAEVIAEPFLRVE
jgi:hypothetical protein